MVHEFAPLTAPLGPATPDRSPQTASGRGGTNPDSRFLPPGAKRHWGEQPRRQARRGGPSAMDWFTIPFSPPGAKRHWGEQPRRQARRGGPSAMDWFTSSLRSPPPSARLRRTGPPRRPPAEGGQTLTPGFSPQERSDIGGREASPPGEARGAVRDGLVHEFAPLTAPLGPAFAGAVPPDGLRPRGDKP
jgi:hypothetical protein